MPFERSVALTTSVYAHSRRDLAHRRVPELDTRDAEGARPAAALDDDARRGRACPPAQARRRDLLVRSTDIPKKLKRIRNAVEKLAVALKEEAPHDERQQHHAVYVISVFAELAGVPETLRITTRGPLEPSTNQRDRALLRPDLPPSTIQELTTEGVNLVA